MTKTRFTYLGLFVLSLTLAQMAEGQVGSSSNPALIGQSVLLVASVEVPQGITAVPTGTMTFLDGAIALGTVPLAQGSAQLTTEFTTVGTHQITASYSGDGVFNPAVSSPFVETITADQGFTLSVTPVQMSVTAGNQSSGTISIFANGSVAQATAVEFSCEGLPAGAECKFGMTSLVPALTGTNTSLAITTTAAAKKAAILERSPLLWAPLLFGLLLVRGSKQRKTLLTMLILTLGLLAIGCGTHTKLLSGPTPSGTYAIQVVATGGNLTRTSTVELVVQ